MIRPQSRSLREGLLRDEKGTFEVHYRNLVKRLFGSRRYRPAAADAGVVYKNVKTRAAAKLVKRRVGGLEELANSGQRADVALNGNGLAAGGFDFADDRGGCLGVFLVVHQDRRPGLGDAQRNGPADASAGPGNEGGFALQCHALLRV